MGYPAPKRRNWVVQIEFLDGTTIDAASDEDAIERWRRLAGWTDPTADADPVAWMNRVIARARTFYCAELPGLTANAPAALILDALSAENCISLRRK